MTEKHILLLGAGRSTGSIISYLSNHLTENRWFLTVADVSIEQAQQKISNTPNCTAAQIDITNTTDLQSFISKADIVISMIPAHMHYPVAVECVEQGKSFFTASYVSPEISKLNTKAKEKGLLLLMETGLDPGIDHMSAMQEIDLIKSEGGEITLFKSFTGGLVAPESDDNPWNYKFTWNPKNVILAGQGTVKFIRNGKYKHITYHNLFKRLETIEIDGYDEFEGYANRDSLKYRDIYGLSEIPTLLRGTLRKKGYCSAWDIFVQLGMTDDTYLIDCKNLTYRDFINSYLVYSETKSVEEKLSNFFKTPLTDPIFKKLEWCGILSKNLIPLTEASPADILLELFEDKWTLKANDKDMVVMQHQFEYILNNKKHFKTSSLVIKGENSEHTSMAKTVGLPLGIAVKLHLQNKLNLTGVHIPVLPEIYNPIMEELKNYGINFNTKLNYTNI